MPFTLFVPLLLIGGFLTYVVFYAIARLARIPRDVARWRTKHRVRRARAALLRGLIKLAEGNHVEAETELLSGLRYSEAPLMNHLAAAFSAQEQNALEKRDEQLAAAQRSAPESALAIGMMQAWLQHRAEQHEQALATLSELRQSHPRHRYLLRLLADVYGELSDWTGLAELIPELRNLGALPHSEIDALELRAHKELLQLRLPSGSLDVLARAWSAVPKPLQRHPMLVAIYARQLIKQNEMQQAETVLRIALDQQWSEELVLLYGHAYGENLGEQLAHAEAWFGAHPEDASLHLSCGRLALRANDLAKARAYLEKSTNLGGPIDAYAELGALLERMGEKDRALNYYRRGLEQSASDRSPARRSSGMGARYRLVGKS
jgi:HemY protein